MQGHVRGVMHCCTAMQALQRMLSPCLLLACFAKRSETHCEIIKGEENKLLQALLAVHSAA